MIEGIGVDIVDINRIRKIHKKNGSFAEKLLTSNELVVYNNLSDNRQVEFLAGRFAAKEAYAKAYGTGIGSSLHFTDLEISNSELGRPFFSNQPFKGHCHVTIAHEADYAVANVILETR